MRSLIALLRVYGIDLKKLIIALSMTPKFLWQYYRMVLKNKSVNLKPCLFDFDANAGVDDDEYFLQDLFVSQLIFKSNVSKHLDVGSRIDGFVAHIATFMEVTIGDLRKFPYAVPNINYTHFNLLDNENYLQDTHDEKFPSISCLHTIEHLGLGRYGDSLKRSKCVEIAVENLAKLCSEGGKLYISTPVGNERIEFNANYIYSPKYIISCFRINKLRIDSIHILDKSLNQVRQLQTLEEYYDLGSKNYTLAIFVLTKANSPIQDLG